MHTESSETLRTNALVAGMSEDVLLDIKKRLKFDLTFIFFYLLPCLQNFRLDTETLARQTGLTQKQCDEWSHALQAAGLWRVVSRNGRKSVVLGKAQLRLEEATTSRDSLSTFLTLSSQIHTMIEDNDANSSYDAHVQSTTPEIYQEFKSDIEKAFSKFVAASDSKDSTILVSWSNAFFRSPTGIPQERGN